MAQSSKVKRTPEYALGYIACANNETRSRNPYASIPHMWIETVDWDAGWTKRFWNEAINSPDPEDATTPF